eukprot:gene7276-7349_t
MRLFVVDASAFDDEDPSLKGFKKAFINATMLEETGEEWAFNEGCLSIPDIREDVYRCPVIRLSYYDENWKHHEETFKGMAARVIQHEYDHIEGKLFTDKLSPLRKRLIEKRLNDISKGIVDRLLVLIVLNRDDMNYQSHVHLQLSRCPKFPNSDDYAVLQRYKTQTVLKNSQSQMLKGIDFPFRAANTLKNCNILILVDPKADKILFATSDNYAVLHGYKTKTALKDSQSQMLKADKILQVLIS